MACIHPDTFKYTFDPSAVEALWEELQSAYGPVDHNPAFKTVQLEIPAFYLRAVDTGNPITVVRKRHSTAADVAALHELFGLSPETTAMEE